MSEQHKQALAVSELMGGAVSRAGIDRLQAEVSKLEQ